MVKRTTTFLDIMDSITPGMYNQESFYQSLKSLYDGEHAIISFKEMIPEVTQKIRWGGEWGALVEDISTIIVSSAERWYHELQGLVCGGFGPDKRPDFEFYDIEWDTPIGSTYRVPVAVFDDHKRRNVNIGFPDFKAIPQEIRNEFNERFNEYSEKFYGFSVLIQFIHKLKRGQFERITHHEFLVRFNRSVHRDEPLPATSDKTEAIPVETTDGRLPEKDYNALHKEMKNDIAQQSINNGCTNLGLPSSDPTIATPDDLVAFDTEDKRRTAILVRIPVLVVDTRHDLYQKFIGHLTTLASDSSVLNVNEQSICPEKILKFRIPLMLGGIIEKELDVFVVWFRGVSGVIKVSVPLDPVTGEKTSDWKKFLPDACAHSYLLQVISSLGNIARRRMIIDMLQSESYIRLSPEAILKKARVIRREQPKETPESNGMFFDTEGNTAIVVQ